MSREKDAPRMIPSVDAAEILGRDPHTLAIWRSQKYGPTPRRKVGNMWFYDEAEVLEFAKALRLVSRKPSGGV
jgi:MerR-like DNA binding protein